MKTSNKTLNIFILCIATAFLSACGSDSNNAATPIPKVPAPTPTPARDYQISILNLTAGQIFSPIALVAHDDSYRAFNIGDVSTVGLEVLAEGGDNTDFLAEANAETGVFLTVSGSGPVVPGATEVLTFSVRDGLEVGMMLSTVTMLINTNDAITAAQSLSIENLAVGESLTIHTVSFDTGTEANSEGVGSIPGPVDGGEGFNADRDDLIDIIHGHSGVVTADDGLANSILNGINRWDNPVAKVTVTRMQ